VEEICADMRRASEKMLADRDEVSAPEETPP